MNLLRHPHKRRVHNENKLRCRIKIVWETGADFQNWRSQGQLRIALRKTAENNVTAECWTLSSAPVFSIGDFELSKNKFVFVADAEMKTQDQTWIWAEMYDLADKAQIKKCYRNNVKKKFGK